MTWGEFKRFVDSQVAEQHVHADWCKLESIDLSDFQKKLPSYPYGKLAVSVTEPSIGPDGFVRPAILTIWDRRGHDVFEDQ